MTPRTGDRLRRPPVARRAIIYLILYISVFAAARSSAETWRGPFPSAPQPPVRVVAVADTLDLGDGRFIVRECLDVHNDDFRLPLAVRSVTADTWTGHRPDAVGEKWLEGEEPIVIPPGQIRRCAERQRQVAGRHVRNWRVRWIRFRIETDRGEFLSNVVSSPQRPPCAVEENKLQPGIDSLSAPGKSISRGDY